MAGAGLCTKEVSPGVDDNEAYSSIRIFLRRVTFCEKYCERLRASYLYKRDSSYYFNKLVPCDMKRLFRFKRSISNAKTVVKGELYSTYIDFSDIRQNLNKLSKLLFSIFVIYSNWNNHILSNLPISWS